MNKENRPQKAYSRAPQIKYRQFGMLYYVDDERFLLPAPMSRNPGKHCPRRKIARVFSLLTQEKLTHKAVVKVMRALIDMGSSVYLIREDWYNNLRLWGRGG